MRVLVTGATGLIGGAAARRFIAEGHEVVALARSDVSAERSTRDGLAVTRGNLTDAASIAEAARGVDAVVHAASSNDRDAAANDETATRAILAVLRGTGKRFIYTSGCLVYGATGDVPATEDGPLAPAELVRWRRGLEEEVLAVAGDGVHPVVIRPGWVYGGRRGYAMMMVAEAADRGIARHVGDGRNRWTCVHADDLAELYTLVLAAAPSGSVYNGVHGAPIPLIEVARAASEAGGAAGRVEAWPLDKARHDLGDFADAIACDQVVSGSKAKRELGWRPTRRPIVDELRSYAAA